MDAKTITLLLISALAMFSQGCDAMVGGDAYDDVEITVSEDAYPLHLDDALTLTIRNKGRESIYTLCGGARGLEEWIDGKLSYAWPAFQLQCLRVEEILPGQTVSRRFGWSDDYFELGKSPELTERARYRIRVVIYEDEEREHQIDRMSQRSNAFRILP